MDMFKKLTFLTALFLILLGCSKNPQNVENITPDILTEKFYYAIEINSVLCGYSEINLSPLEKNEIEWILLDEEVFLMVTALGSQFNMQQKIRYHIDPVTGNFSYHDNEIKQGQIEFGCAYNVEGNTATIIVPGSAEFTTIPLSQNVILPNTMIFTFLKRDFVDGGLEEKRYQILEVRNGEIQEVTYTKIGSEQLNLAGESYNTIVLNELNHKTGLKVKIWVGTERGHLLKMESPAYNRVQYRTDASVIKRIQVANVNENVIVRTNEFIADAENVSYMKVRAVMEPNGLWITEESLNTPGQKFTGSVIDNRIEGVFEIEHGRYDGLDAPQFPTDFSRNDSLKEYLEPEQFCESNDPKLVEKAQEITAGSQNAWEAACRLSRWVTENISYAIPGGISALNTYETREGECGAHSRLLAAFCRAVGIPARVVWGCMYLPNYGGSFGQHGWNEIYMGDAGWVPVDATALENDYVDSGHIRIGVLGTASVTLNHTEMEILEYRIGW